MSATIGCCTSEILTEARADTVAFEIEPAMVEFLARAIKASLLRYMVKSLSLAFLSTREDQVCRTQSESH